MPKYTLKLRVNEERPRHRSLTLLKKGREALVEQFSLVVVNTVSKSAKQSGILLEGLIGEQFVDRGIGESTFSPTLDSDPQRRVPLRHQDER